MPSSVTLVDAMVVISGHEHGWFADLARRVPLAVASQVVREAVYFKQPDGTRTPIDLTPLFQGVLHREAATLDELAGFIRACPRSGLGAGETESLAIVHARGFAFCTADAHAMKVMRLMRLGSRWRSLENLFSAAGLDPRPLGDAWRNTAWPK